MDKTEREVFRQALIEAFVRKYERELAECQETADCSEAHTLRMQEIVAQSAKSERRKDRRKWIGALLVAAALLLTACTVYAYHEEIRDFIEKVYEKGIIVTYSEKNDASNEDLLIDKYTLGYVPEGYMSTVKLYLLTSSRCEWENSEGQYIIFEQCSLDSTNFSLDVETGETRIITCGKYDVYCRSSDAFTYIWNDGRYSFKIKSSIFIQDETLIRIIEGIDIVE